MASSSRNNPSRNVCRIGTRGSDLALWQARTIQGRLRDLGVETEIEIIKTRGDRIDNIPFSELEGKNFFTKELEDAQLAGRVDLAVHSLKDLATETPPGLTLTAMVGREDPRDVLLADPAAVDRDRLNAGDPLPLKSGARIGTSAARRQAQIRFLRDDLEILDLRGNVPTRVDRLREGLYDGILLARAGVLRLELDLDDLAVMILEIDAFVPAPAQGMLGIQCPVDNPWRDTLNRLDCPVAGRMVAAERALLQRLEGGCQLPFGVNIQPVDDQWRLEVFLSGYSDQPLRVTIEGSELDTLVNECWEMISEYRGD